MVRSKPLFDNWDLGGGTDAFAGFTKPNTRDMFMPLDSGINDIDANNFIRGAGITDGFQKVVIHELVKNLKLYNLWDKLLVAYPFIGGTAARHGFNLKDYTTFNASFVNSPTHNSLGTTFNGSNQYMNTLFNPLSRNVNPRDCGMSIYLTATTQGYCGADGANDEYLLLGSNATQRVIGMCCSRSIAAVTPIIDVSITSGFQLCSRQGDIQFVMRNKHLVSRYDQDPLTGKAPNRNLYVGCRNSAGTPTTYHNGTVRWFAASTGLTHNEAITLNKVIQRYQERLERAVY